MGSITRQQSSGPAADIGPVLADLTGWDPDKTLAGARASATRQIQVTGRNGDDVTVAWHGGSTYTITWETRP